MQILSIQSQVIYGHVGNSAAVFPLQCLGHTVWAVPTLVASNHPGYPDFAVQAFGDDVVARLLDGLARRGVLARCDLVVGGYLGSRAVGQVIIETAGRVRDERPDALFCCDPVIGDRDTGVYVDAEIPDWYRSAAVPAADILTPNLFELELLTEHDPGALEGADLPEIVAAAQTLRDRMRVGGRLMVTSVAHADLDPEHICVLAVAAEGAWTVVAPRLAFSRPPHGAGDLVSALFAVACAEDRSPDTALSHAVNIVHAVLAEAAGRDGAEMDPVAARDAIVAPVQRFAAQFVS